MLGQGHAAGAGTSMLPPVQGSLLPRAWLHKRQEHAAYYERCVAELERHRAQLAVGTQSQEACCEAFDLLSECLAVSMEDCQTLSETMTQVDSTYVAQAARVLQLTESVQKSRELLGQTADALVASEAERDADEHTLYSVARYSHQKQKATKALHAWRRCAAHRASRRHLLRKALRRVQRVVIGAAFRRWLHYTAGKLDLQTRLQAVVRRVQHVALSSAFARWDRAAHRALRVRTVCETALARLRLRVLWQAFVLWRKLVRRMKRVRGMMRHGHYRVLRGAFVSWLRGWSRCVQRSMPSVGATDVSEYISTLEGIVDTVSLRLDAAPVEQSAIRTTARAVYVWRRCAAYRASRRHLLRKALRRVQHVVIGAAFRRWLHYTAGKLDLQTRLQAVVRRVQHVALSSAFTRWDRAAHRALRVRTVCETALARLRLRVLWQFFHVLVGATWRMKLVRGMMQHGHYRVLRGAFADWSGVVRYLVSKRSLIAQQDQLRQDVQRSFSDSVRTFSSSLEVKIKRYQQSHGASPQSCTQQGQLLEGVPPVAESVALATPRRNTHVVLSNFDRSESPIDDAQRLQRTPCTPMVSARARQLLDDLRNAEQSLAQHAR
eukprot:COSAG02_NODE_4608_length_5171_cov_3.998028_2_plen_606_part_00